MTLDYTVWLDCDVLTREMSGNQPKIWSGSVLRQTLELLFIPPEKNKLK